MTYKHPEYPDYVPIIKWQAWEQIALKETLEDVARFTLPCVEVRDSKQHNSLMVRLTDVWSRPVLVDYANPEGRLTGERARELQAFLEVARKDQLSVSPVLHPLDAIALSAGLAKEVMQFSEIVLRLRTAGPTILQTEHHQIQHARDKLGAHEKSSRLIVDLGATPVTWTEADAISLAGEIMHLKAQGFDQIHLASGAFPESLAKVISVATPERRDWELWEAVNGKSVGVQLGYSDYGPLSPKWTEEVLTRRGGRVVIRYTRDKDWLVLRADGNKKAHSVAISNLLVGLYKASFKAASFSYGDKLIADRADSAVPEKNKKGGQIHIAEYWTHHMAMVIKEQY
jgi:hypothetical protein